LIKEAKQQQKELDEEKKRRADEANAAWLEKLTKNWKVKN
jgi:hypothetical protein